jgi:hypothetical protein
MSRPSKYATEEERLEARRAQTRERVARWIEAHPRRWSRIMNRHKAKLRAQKELTA